MNEEPYQIALEAAQDELRQLEANQKKLDERVARLRETIITLSRLVKGESLFSSAVAEGMGLTDSVRQALTASGKWMSPMQVRDGLVRIGVDPTAYNNLLASVHNILKRLIDSKEVVTKEIEGKMRYRWKGTSRPITGFSGTPLPLQEEAEHKMSKTEDDTGALKRFAEGRRKENFLQAMAKELKDKK